MFHLISFLFLLINIKINIYNFIAALAKLPTLRCPILPDLTLHWLAVEGTQPLIPENPSFSNNSNYYDQPYDLPQEMQHFYSRITGAILTNDSSTLPAVYHSLQNDAGLQELLPYMSRFIYQQIKVNTKSLPLLLGLIKSLRSILYNRYLRAEFHIQQILPAIFTCIVAARLSSTYNEDHWQLRSIAAELISFICVKYSEQFPDLQARVCKTFIDALSDDKSLTAVYGGIVGLSSLGHTVIKSLLLPHIGRISNRISKQQIDNDIKKNLSNNNLEKINSKHNKKGNDLSGNEIIKDNIKYPTENEIASLKCREALLYSLGKYIITCMSMPVITTSLSDFTRNQNSNSISTTDNNKKKRIIEKKIDNNNDEEKISYLCDLEEELVPYYLLKSTQLPYCQYFI